MKENWRYLYAIPHVEIPNSIDDLDGTIAIVGAQDQRLLNLRSSSQQLDKFVQSFKTCFGKSVASSALLLRERGSSDEEVQKEARGFRDIVVLCAIFEGWAQSIGAKTPGGVLWSDYFDFYPVYIGNKGDYHYSTPAVLGVHNSDYFNHDGRTSPRLGQPGNVTVHLDELTFAMLLEGFRLRYRKAANDDTKSKLDVIFALWKFLILHQDFLPQM